eukprot:m.61494 g.61494  ORF g.61494 m.61494 type:complete len:172 (-) comp15762_c0_seq3:244-759(-)
MAVPDFVYQLKSAEYHVNVRSLRSLTRAQIILRYCSVLKGLQNSKQRGSTVQQHGNDVPLRATPVKTVSVGTTIEHETPAVIRSPTALHGISAHLARFERDMLSRSAVKVLQSRENAGVLHSARALSSENCTRAAAALDQTGSVPDESIDRATQFLNAIGLSQPIDEPRMH